MAWVRSPFGLPVLDMWDVSCIEEASGCHLGEGKKWVSETGCCVHETVCNTTHMGEQTLHSARGWKASGEELKSTEYKVISTL
eukprot:5080781-Ditylum_brightwellii.AAC.1